MTSGGKHQAKPPQGAEKERRLREIVLVFLKLGTIAFGGPAAHIAMMEDEVVQKRAWVTRDQFMDLVGATNLMPGPNSTELAIHLGYRRGGIPGLFAGGAAFILPAMLISLLFAWLYVRFGNMPHLEGVLVGIKPMIIAVVLQALLRLGKSAVKDRVTGAVAAMVVALSLLGVSEIPLLLAAGLFLVVWRNFDRIRSKLFSVSPLPLAWLASAAQTAPAVPQAMRTLGTGTIFLTFLKIGSFLYGSGYVLLAFLEREFVHGFQALTPQQLLDAVAVGQFKPGPVFTTATFAGYLMDGLPGAIAATVGIFLPPFLLVLILSPLVPRMRTSPWWSAALDGVNAASLGIMAVVTLRLGLASVVNPFTAALLALGLLAVMKLKLNAAWVVLSGALLGFGYTLVL